MPLNLSISEQLTYSTVRIECELVSGGVSTGTGFFYRFADKGESHVPAIVTNNHVVEGALRMKIHFHINDNGSESAPSNHTSYTLEDVGSICIPHPDKEVDLCVIPIGPILNHAAEQKKQLFLIPMDKSLLPSREEVAGLTAIEEVVMIGYPNGLWDSVNNKPIVRRGITATHPHFDYNGKQEFMIDAACFPGSSGSPVLLFNQGNYSTKSGDLVIGTRLKLLGVLYAGPQITAQGDIAVVDVPTQQRPIALSNIPMNLGYVIKAEKLLDFETLLEQLK